MTRLRRLDWFLLAGAFALSVALRALATVGFDGLYGQDPYAYYNFAQTLRQAMSTRSALPPFFWPLGYPALLAVGFAIFGTSPLTAQAISLVLGSLLAPMVYVLARQIGARAWGALAAALIVAACGQAIQSSFVVMSDIPALFWATVSALALVQYLALARPHPSVPSPLRREGKVNAANDSDIFVTPQDETREGAIHDTSVMRNASQYRWLVIAALTLVIACVTRWLYLALIPVWGAAVLLTWRRVRWRETLVAGAAVALILIPQAAVSIHSPYPVLDHAWVQGWSPLNAFAHEFTNIDGHFVYSEINAEYYAQPYFDSYWIAPLFAPFLLIGLWALARQRAAGTRNDVGTEGTIYRAPTTTYPQSSRISRAALLVILLGWALLPYLFLAGIPYQNIRFPLIVVPAVAALAGIGLEFVLSRWKLVFAALMIGGLALMIRTDKPLLATFVANQTLDKQAVQWALQHVPANARLYTFSLTEPLKAYGSFDVHELYDESPESIAAQLSDGKDSYVFVNVWNIENQWIGQPLQATYHWLRDHVGLLYLDRVGYYSLFWVVDENRTPPAGLQQPSG